MKSRSCGRPRLPPDDAGPRRMVGRLLASVLLGVVLIGVGGAHADAGHVPSTRLQLDVGADLYQLRCSGCHGLNGEGLIGPSLVDSTLGIDAVIDQITNGAGSMPAFSGVLSAAEIDAVAQHVIGFRPAPSTTTTSTSTTTTTPPTTTTSSTTTSTSTTTTAPPTTTTSTTSTSTTVGSTTSSTDPVASDAATAVDSTGDLPLIPLAIAGVTLAGGLWFVMRRRRTG